MPMPININYVNNIKGGIYHYPYKNMILNSIKPFQLL